MRNSTNYTSLPQTSALAVERLLSLRGRKRPGKETPPDYMPRTKALSRSMALLMFSWELA